MEVRGAAMGINLAMAKEVLFIFSGSVTAAVNKKPTPVAKMLRELTLAALRLLGYAFGIIGGI